MQGKDGSFDKVMQGEFTVAGEKVTTDDVNTNVPDGLRSMASDMLAGPDLGDFKSWAGVQDEARIWSLSYSRRPTLIDDAETYSAQHSILCIGANQSGDIYHVKAAHAVNPELHICIYGVPAAATNARDRRLIANAAMMAEYFNGAIVVCMPGLKPVPGEGRYASADAYCDEFFREGEARGFMLDIGQATTLVSLALNSDPGADLRIRHSVAPEYATAAAYAADLRNNGFRTGVPYVLVMYRGTGHGGGIHPEHDTGRTGFLQLMNAVDELGAEPVDMGDFPSFVKSEEQATLKEYWTWPSVRLGGRNSQAGLIRYLAENFNVIGAIGMRSGAMDMLAFAGIPILSIDIDPLLRPDHEEQPSWARTNKLESEYGSGRYGTIYVERDHTSEADERNFQGTFSPRDMRNISDELERRHRNHDGSLQRPPGDHGRHRSHPYSEASARMALRDLQDILDALGDGVTPGRLRNLRNETARIDIVVEQAYAQRAYAHPDDLWLNDVWEKIKQVKTALGKAVPVESDVSGLSSGEFKRESGGTGKSGKDKMGSGGKKTADEPSSGAFGTASAPVHHPAPVHRLAPLPRVEPLARRDFNRSVVEPQGPDCELRLKGNELIGRADVQRLFVAAAAYSYGSMREAGYYIVMDFRRENYERAIALAEAIDNL